MWNAGRRPIPVVLLAGAACAPLAAAPSALAGQDVPPAYSVLRATDPPTIDGVLDEPVWGEAPRIPLRWEYAPGENVEPPVETVCHVAFDVAALYLACRASDPEPSEIRAHFAERDDRARLHQDDHVAFLVDPFNDERRGFEFRVSAAGEQWDAVHVKVEGFEDFSWDALWTSAVRTTDAGWDLEVAIPFSALRFPASSAGGDPQTWGFIIERSYPRGVRYRMRSVPTDRSTNCLLCGANKVSGFEGMSPGGTLELEPAMTAKREDVRSPFPDGELSSLGGSDLGGMEPDIGMDLRWSVTPSTSLNATINPDFSHVEADEAQLGVNRRFALLFPERRPFFLEAADYFLTPLDAVFTRTIADPEGGLKLTGKEGANTLGVFAAQDQTTTMLFPANQGSTESFIAGRSHAAVGRYRRELGPTSYVGALVTSRTADDYRNVVAGVDAAFQPAAGHTVRLQYIRSDTDYPDSLAAARGQEVDGFGGGGLLASWSLLTREWSAGVEVQDLTRGFRADLGFVPRVDLRSLGGSLSRIFRGPAGGWFTQIALTGAYGRTQDQDGDLTDESVTARLTYRGPRQSVAVMGAGRVKMLHDGVLYDLDRADVSLDVRPSGSATLGAAVRFGDFVDFTNDRRSFGVSLTPNAQFDFGSRVSLNVSDTYQRLSYEGQEVYTANILQGRLLYHFGVDGFVRAVVQYRTLDRNPAAWTVPVAEKSQQLLTQLVFSYEVTPQASVYVGYTDSQEGGDDFDLLSKARTLFIKVGYAIYP